MNKIDILKELIKNSTNRWIKEDLENYVELIEESDPPIFLDDTFVRLDNCIDFIIKVEFDISGWALDEIPIYYCHCFCHNETGKYFNLNVVDIGHVVPSYINSSSNEQDANSIQEAIEKFVI